MDWNADFDNAFSDVFRKRNLLPLLSLWLGSLLLFVVYGTLGGPRDPQEACLTLPGASLQENETGAVWAQRQAAETESQLSYRITFDNLCARDRAAGVFRTASGKQVCIDNLCVTFCRSAASPGAGNSGGWRDFYDLFAPRRQDRLAMTRLGILDAFQADPADWRTSLNLANAVEVQIRGLNWRIDDGSVTSLQVQCRHAFLRGQTPWVTLRGRVIVRAQGITLEGNHIDMDVREERFLVRGRYRLMGAERNETGRGACFDRTLKPLDVWWANTGESKAWVNGLPSGPF
jgi:hypothetical protein